jgi:DNA-binding NtrC family response regulator
MSDFGPDTGKVRAIHRLHVLVAAHDRRFLRMAGFLLSRSGFTVSTSRRRGDLLPAVDINRPDVVIIDGTASLSEAAANAAVIEALHPGTTVVIVAEDDRIPAVTNLRVRPKWKAFDELVSRIERIHLGLPEAKAEGG